jgi:hypothetical protein
MGESEVLILVMGFVVALVGGVAAFIKWLNRRK